MIRPGQEEWWRWRQTRSALWWSKPAGRATTIASGGGKNPSQKKVLKNIYRSEQECDQQCQTVQERQCSTVNMQICSTRNEQQCSTGEPIPSILLRFISLFSGRWNIDDNIDGQLTSRFLFRICFSTSTNLMSSFFSEQARVSDSAGPPVHNSEWKTMLNRWSLNFF